MCRETNNTTSKHSSGYAAAPTHKTMPFPITPAPSEVVLDIVQLDTELRLRREHQYDQARLAKRRAIFSPSPAQHKRRRPSAEDLPAMQLLPLLEQQCSIEETEEVTREPLTAVPAAVSFDNDGDDDDDDYDLMEQLPLLPPLNLGCQRSTLSSLKPRSLDDTIELHDGVIRQTDSLPMFPML